MCALTAIPHFVFYAGYNFIAMYHTLTLTVSCAVILAGSLHRSKVRWMTAQSCTMAIALRSV